MKAVKIVMISILLLSVVHRNGKAFWGDLFKTEADEQIDKLTDNAIKVLDNVATLGSQIVDDDIQKIAELKTLRNINQQALQSNNSMILYEKAKLKQGIKRNANSSVLQISQKNIATLQNKNKALKEQLLSTQSSMSEKSKYSAQLKKKVEEIGFFSKFGKSVKSIFKYEEAIKAYGAVTGEIYAWQEGNSSFKNVVLRTMKEGTRAGMVVGSGAIAGTFSSAIATPVIGTGVGLAVSNGADYMYQKTIGKAIDAIMDREHYNINVYKQDPEVLEKRRAENRRKAIDEQKMFLKQLGAKEDEYNAILADFIQQQNETRRQIEEEFKQAEARERERKATETPVLTYTKSKENIKPGETVTFDINVQGGLEPITIFGDMNTTIENRYDRNFSFNWTPEEGTGPGIYEYHLEAKSASGKTASLTTSVNVIAGVGKQEDSMVNEPSEIEEEHVSSGILHSLHQMSYCYVQVKLLNTNAIASTNDWAAEQNEEIELEWNGTNFSGKFREFASATNDMGIEQSLTETITINGTVSQDGKEILQISFKYNSARENNVGIMHAASVHNIPFDNDFRNHFTYNLQGHQCARYISSIETVSKFINSDTGEVEEYPSNSMETSESSEITIVFYNND